MRNVKFLVLGCALAGVCLVPGSARADIVWNVTYLDGSGGFADPVLGAGRRQVVGAVTTYLNSVLDETGVVDFQFNISLNTGVQPLATSGPRFSGSPNGFQNGHLFTHATTGVDPDSNNPDATAQVNFGFTWNNTTAQPKPFEVDLQSVLLHEFTHSLGVLSRLSSSGQSNISNSDPGVYSVYNSFLRTGNTGGGVPLFGVGGDYLGTAADLVTPQPGIYFWGANAMAANGGKPVRVFVQNNVFNGSSISHLAAPSVMVFASSAGDVKRRYTGIDLAVLRDLGWKTKPQLPGNLGPSGFKVLGVNPSGVGVGSDDLNGGGLVMTGVLGGLDVEGDGGRAVFVEDAATARPGGAGRLTQVSHPEAPGAIALLADDLGETGIGMTWFGVAENLAMPLAGNMVTRFGFKVNPNVRGGAGGVDGTFADFTFGATAAGLAGGALGTDGVGLRLYSSGAKAGLWELFDGTSGLAVLEDSGVFGSGGVGVGGAATNGFVEVAVEILGATFDRSVSESVSLYVGGELVHSFGTDAGFLANYVTFYGGGSATRGGGQALYAFSDLDVGVFEVPEAGGVGVLALGAGVGLGRRRRGEVGWRAAAVGR